MIKPLKLKLIYNFKSFNIYEIDIEAYGKPLLSIEGIDYVVLKEIHDYDTGGHKLTDITGKAYSKALVTDDKMLVSDARQKKYLEDKKRDKWEKEQVKERSAKLQKYLEDKDSIYISVSFHQKDAFKKCFMGRTIWDKAKKSWKLRFENEDFENLKCHSIKSLRNDVIEICLSGTPTFNFIVYNNGDDCDLF